MLTDNDHIHYTYVPALKWRILTRFYDFACSVALLGKSYKKVLADTIPLQAGYTVLDVGCGTGELIQVIKEKYPGVSAYGADPDVFLLNIARENLQKKALSADLVQAYAEHLPFPNDTFDAVFCVLTLHHIPSELKIRALQEMRRVLKPSGVLLLSDYGKKKVPIRGLGQFIFENKANLKDHLEGRIPGYIAESGLQLISEKKYHQVFMWVAKK